MRSPTACTATCAVARGTRTSSMPWPTPPPNSLTARDRRWPVAEGNAPYIGRSMKRVEDPRLIKGIGTYTDDVRLPGLLHAALLRSPHAHARIVSIDTAAAKAIPGVT